MAEIYYQRPVCVIMRIQASDGQPSSAPQA
jgi:hypothetical protein